VEELETECGVESESGGPAAESVMNDDDEMTERSRAASSYREVGHNMYILAQQVQKVFLCHKSALYS